jgi:hypothetical protein
VPSYLHADQHAIVFHPDYDGLGNRTVYFANDGGIFRSDDAHAPIATSANPECSSDASSMAFTALNHNFGITQFYNGAVFPDGHRFIAGAQDNGTVIGSIDGGSDAWVRALGGDGAYVAIDPVDPNNVYAGYQFANVHVSEDGGATFRPMTLGLNDQFLFITPMTLDPNHSKRLWLGGRSMWRFTGSVWQRASFTLPGLVSAIAVSPGNSDFVVAGTNDGSIVRTDSATTSGPSSQWTAVKPREGFVTSLAFDPRNTDIVWATYAGFGGTHIWRSLDRGSTWEPRDGSGSASVPDIPVHSIVIDPTTPGRIFLGTDLGVFVSTDDGASWHVENTGFATVVTETVLIAPGERGPALYAFTHGRGAWRADLVIDSGPRRRSIRR